MQETVSISRSGRSPGVGNGNLPQYSCLENLMDRGAGWATVHGVARVGYDLVTKQQQSIANGSEVGGSRQSTEFRMAGLGAFKL